MRITVLVIVVVMLVGSGALEYAPIKDSTRSAPIELGAIARLDAVSAPLETGRWAVFIDAQGLRREIFVYCRRSVLAEESVRISGMMLRGRVPTYVGICASPIPGF